MGFLEQGEGWGRGGNKCSAWGGYLKRRGEDTSIGTGGWRGGSLNGRVETRVSGAGRGIIGRG